MSDCKAIIPFHSFSNTMKATVLNELRTMRLKNSRKTVART